VDKLIDCKWIAYTGIGGGQGRTLSEEAADMRQTSRVVLAL